MGVNAGHCARLEDQGVWDEHFRLELRPDHTFALNVLSEALVALNGQYVQSATLKNSDIIQAGAVRLQLRDCGGDWEMSKSVRSQ